MFRKLSTTLVAAAVTGLACTSALAQNTPMRRPGADKDFLMTDAQGAAYELESAKLATQKASRADVKAYGEKLVHDHEAYNAALQQLGKEEHLDLPNDLTAGDTIRLTALKALSGALFDRAYVKEAKRINADDLSDAKKELDSNSDEGVKAFISKFAGVDAEHERLAKALEN